MNNISKTVLITGANSGLGYEAAKTLARSGDWQIVIASRNRKKTDAAVTTLKNETGHPAICGMTLDLGSFASIRSFADQFKQANLPPLRVIACNAGLSPMSNQVTADGIDMIFGVNHLGHYLLVHLLSDTLVDPGRVIFTSSGTHLPEHRLARNLRVPVPKYSTAEALAFPDESLPDHRISNPSQRYSTSKLCNVLATYEFSRQYEAAGRNIGVFAIDPGLMPGTGLTRDLPGPVRSMVAGLIGFFDRWVDGIRYPEVSGRDLARLITDPSLDGLTALYFDGHQEVNSSDDSYDRAKAADLWNTSTRLSALKPEETPLKLQI